MKNKGRKITGAILALGLVAGVSAAAALTTLQKRSQKEKGTRVDYKEAQTENDRVLNEYKQSSDQILDAYSKYLSTPSYLSVESLRDKHLMNYEQINEQTKQEKLQELEKLAKKLSAKLPVEKAMEVLKNADLTDEQKADLQKAIDNLNNVVDSNQTSQDFEKALNDLLDATNKAQAQSDEAIQEEKELENAKKELLQAISDSKVLKDTLLESNKAALDEILNRYEQLANATDATTEGLIQAKANLENELKDLMLKNDKEALLAKAEAFKSSEAYTSATQEKQQQLDQLVEKVKALDLSTKEGKESYLAEKENLLNKMKELEDDKAARELKVQYLAKADELAQLAANGGNYPELGKDVPALSAERKAILDSLITSDKKALNSNLTPEQIQEKLDNLSTKYKQLVLLDELDTTINKAKEAKGSLNEEHQAQLQTLIDQKEALKNNENVSADELQDAINQLNAKSVELKLQEELDEATKAYNSVKEHPKYSSLTEQDKTELEDLMTALKGLDISDPSNQEQFNASKTQLLEKVEELKIKLSKSETAEKNDEFKADPMYEQLSEDQKLELEGLASEVANAAESGENAKDNFERLKEQYENKLHELKVTAYKKEAVSQLNKYRDIAANGGQFDDQTVTAFGQSTKDKWEESYTDYSLELTLAEENDFETLKQEIARIKQESHDKFAQLVEEDKKEKAKTQYTANLGRLNNLLNNETIVYHLSHDDYPQEITTPLRDAYNNSSNVKTQSTLDLETATYDQILASTQSITQAFQDLRAAYGKFRTESENYSATHGNPTDANTSSETSTTGSN